MRYTANFDFDSAVTRKSSELGKDFSQYPVLSVKALCESAGIRYGVTGGRQPLIILDPESDRHIKTQLQGEIAYIVGCKSVCRDEPERSARLLELLAYAFHDYAARECVCFKKIFGV